MKMAWLLMTLGLGGCSVGMALHGADNPDIAAVRVGATRYAVESELGRPRRWDAEERRALYHFTTGEEGSAGRAMGHAVGDVLTLGLWEVVGTPIEAVQTHSDWAVDVWYDQDDIVARVAGPRRR